MTKSTTLYANNAQTSLTSTVTTGSASFTVASASAFPTISTAGQFFYVTLDDTVNLEVVKVTAVSSNTFTVARGQDGTTAHAFASGTTTVSNRLNAGSIANFARIDDHMATLAGGITSLTAPSTMNGNSYVLGDTFGDGTVISAFANTSTDLWFFTGYPATVYSGTVGASATSTVIQLASANTVLPDQSTWAYILQFTSGTFKGQARYVSGLSSSAITLSAALSSAPGSSDTYNVYQHVGANSVTLARQQSTLFDPTYVTATTNYLTGAKRITSGDVQLYNGTTWGTYTLNYVPASTTTVGSYSVPTATGGFAGLQFGASYHGQSLLLSGAAVSSGVYRVADSAWDWRWDAGTLAIGTVPYANVSGTPNLSIYAPLASPALTGTPTAPTAAASTNTTQLATTAYVKSQSTFTGNATAGTRTHVSSGIIDQWFTSFQAAAGGGIVTITYPVAFTSTAGIPRITLADANLGSLGASNFVVAQPVTWSLTGCTVNIGQNGGGTRDVTLSIEVRGT